MQNSRSPRTIAALLIACAVAFGVVGGVALDRLLFLPRAMHAGEAPRAAAPPSDGAARAEWNGGARRGPGERYLRHMEAELDLTPQQRTRIDSILADQQARVMEITRETRPLLRQVAEDTRGAIHEVLTPEQRERFQEMRQRRDRRGGEREGDRRHRHGARPGGDSSTPARP